MLLRLHVKRDGQLRRWLFLPLGAVVAVFIFWVAAWLVRPGPPPAMPREATISLVKLNLPQKSLRAGREGGGNARAKPPFSHPARRRPPTAFVILPASMARLPPPARRPLSLSLDPDVRAVAVRRAIAEFLGPGPGAYRGVHWLQGAGGLLSLPDSGMRVRQLRFTCESLPTAQLARLPRLTMEVGARVTVNGKVTAVRYLHGSAPAARRYVFPFLRREMERHWRFQRLVLDGKPTPYRLRFISRMGSGLEPGDRYHCAWGGPGGAAQRGSLTPTWVLYIPKRGLPVAVAYMAVVPRGEPTGGLGPDGG